MSAISCRRFIQIVFLWCEHMDRDTAIKTMITKVYDYKKKNVLSKKEIVQIEKYFKYNYQNHNNLESFCNSNALIKKLIDKLKSGKSEIKKQIQEHKALQRGVLTECVIIQTLATILGLNKFYDLETESVSSIPKEIKANLDKVQDKAQSGCAARYVYYRCNDFENILFQYGNPTAIGDATALLYSNDIIIEIKDMPALLMDKDLEYDEEGHLIITDEIRKDFHDYISYIEEFNAKTTVFNELGHNYPILLNADISIKTKFILSYINSSFMDVLITNSSDDKLVVIRRDDLIRPLSDGQLVLSTEGSEIRMTGKNHKRKAFTPAYLKKTLISLGISIDSNDTCFVDKTNTSVIGFIQGRGTTKLTRFKLTNCFFVSNKDSTLKDYTDHWEFALSDVSQCKSGISIHVNLSKSKSEIRREFEY